MVKHIFILGILLCYLASIGQSYTSLSIDTLNKCDKKGKRIGFWIEFVDKNLIQTKKQKKAVYFRYSYYENDKKIFPPSAPPSRGKCILKINGNNAQKGEIILLDGVYLLYNKNSKFLIERDSIVKGIVWNIKTYNKNGQINEVIDYTKRYLKQSFSCLFITYKKNGNLEFNYYYTKINNKWKFIKKDL